MWVFPKIGLPQNGWKKMENPIKMDDLVGKPTIFGNIHLFSMAKIPRFPKPVGFQTNDQHLSAPSWGTLSFSSLSHFCSTRFQPQEQALDPIGSVEEFFYTEFVGWINVEHKGFNLLYPLGFKQHSNWKMLEYI